MLTSFVALTFGCASYKPDSLTPLDADFAPYVEEIDQVTIAAKKLTSVNCQQNTGNTTSEIK